MRGGNYFAGGRFRSAQLMPSAFRDFLTIEFGKSFAASDISSVIAPANAENGCEKTKADERIRRR
jgi:hypothetical protein